MYLYFIYIYLCRSGAVNSHVHICTSHIHEKILDENDTSTQNIKLPMTWQDWWLHLYPHWSWLSVPQDRSCESKIERVSERSDFCHYGTLEKITEVGLYWLLCLHGEAGFIDLLSFITIEMSNIVIIDCHPSREILLSQGLRIFVKKRLQTCHLKKKKKTAYMLLNLKLDFR